MTHLIAALLLLYPMAAGAQAPTLTHLPSDIGRHLLQQNMAPSCVTLLSHYVTQETPMLCGVASAVMVLNSARVPAPEDTRTQVYRYFTQDNFFSEKIESIVSRAQVQERGLELHELAESLTTWGLQASVVYANQIDQDAFRDLLADTLNHNGYAIINFSRPALGQLGSGHHSPVAAYDAATDQFLVLDVARYKQSAFWIKTEALWRAIDTQSDTHTYRGVVLVAPQETSERSQGA